MQVQLQHLQAAYAFSSRSMDLRCGGQLKPCFSVPTRRFAAFLSKHNFSRIDKLYVTTQSRGI
jgi:hypothetical protein